MVAEPSIFLSESTPPSPFSECFDPERVGIFPDTTIICGRELLAASAEISTLRDFLVRREIVSYIDNPNANAAVVQVPSQAPVIKAIIQTF